MGTEPPEAPVPVGRQNEASPWPTNHLNALVLPEVDAVAPVAEYLLGAMSTVSIGASFPLGSFLALYRRRRRRTTDSYRQKTEGSGQWPVV